MTTCFKKSSIFNYFIMICLFLAGCEGDGSNAREPNSTCHNDGELCSLASANYGVCKNNSCRGCDDENTCPDDYSCDQNGFCIANEEQGPSSTLPLNDPTVQDCIAQTRCNNLCFNIRTECLQAKCDSSNLEWNNIALSDFQEQCKEECADETKISATYCSASPQENYCENFNDFFNKKNINTESTYCIQENTPTPTPYDACGLNNIYPIRAVEFENNIALIKIDTVTKENSLQSNCARSSNGIVFELSSNSGDSGLYRIETTDISYDTVITLHSGTCGQIPNGAQCNDNIRDDRYASGFESVDLDLDSNSYFITVFGDLEARGTAKLRIEKLIDPCEGVENFACRAACEQAYFCVEGYCQSNNLNPKENFVESKISECISACNIEDRSTREFLCNNFQQDDGGNPVQCGGYLNGLRFRENLNTRNYCTDADPACIERPNCEALCAQDNQCLQDYCSNEERIPNEAAISDVEEACVRQCTQGEIATKQRLCSQNACTDLISSSMMAEENYCGDLLVDIRCAPDNVCSGTSGYTFDCLKEYCGARGQAINSLSESLQTNVFDNITSQCIAEATPDRFNTLCTEHTCNDLLDLIEVGGNPEDPLSIENLSDLCLPAGTAIVDCDENNMFEVDCTSLADRVGLIGRADCIEDPFDENQWTAFRTQLIEQCKDSSIVFVAQYCPFRIFEEGPTDNHLRTIAASVFEFLNNTEVDERDFLCSDMEQQPDPNPEGSSFTCAELTDYSCNEIFSDERLDSAASDYCQRIREQELSQASLREHLTLLQNQCRIENSGFRANYCQNADLESNRLIDPNSEVGQNIFFVEANICREEQVGPPPQGEPDFYCNEETPIYCEEVFVSVDLECINCGEEQTVDFDRASDLYEQNLESCTIEGSVFQTNYCNALFEGQLDGICSADDALVNLILGAPEEYCDDFIPPPPPPEPDFYCGEGEYAFGAYCSLIGGDFWFSCASDECRNRDLVIDEGIYFNLQEQSVVACRTDGSAFQTDYCEVLSAPDENEEAECSEAFLNLIFGNADQYCREGAPPPPPPEPDFNCGGDLGVYCSDIIESVSYECGLNECQRLERQIDEEAFFNQINASRDSCRMGGSDFQINYCRALNEGQFEGECSEVLLNLTLGDIENYCM